MKQNPRAAGGTSGGISKKKESTRSGYLQKRGPLGVWQKRWFVFEKGELSYFRNHQHAAQSAVGGGGGGFLAGCCGHVKKARDVGFNGNKPQGVEGVEDKKGQGKHYGDDNMEIDFEVGGMWLRASSVEEKMAWLAVLSNASMVRSMSSRNLDDMLVEPKDVDLGELKFSDLHMGEVVGSGTTGTGECYRSTAIPSLFVSPPCGQLCVLRCLSAEAAGCRPQ